VTPSFFELLAEAEVTLESAEFLEERDGDLSIQ